MPVLSDIHTRVEGVSGMFKVAGTVTDEVLGALETADLVMTAVGEGHLHELGAVLARAALARDSSRPLRVFCAENGVGIAQKLRHAVTRAAGEDRELSEVAAADPRVSGLLSREELEGVFDLGRALARVPEIFRRFSPPG